jgi:hypothetical protein
MKPLNKVGRKAGCIGMAPFWSQLSVEPVVPLKAPLLEAFMSPSAKQEYLRDLYHFFKTITCRLVLIPLPRIWREGLRGLKILDI